MAEAALHPGKDVRAAIGYTLRTIRAPSFYDTAHEKDHVPLAPVEMAIADAWGLATSLDRQGFGLVEHAGAVADLTDLEQLAAVHRDEIAELLKRLTGCDHVAMTPFDILRFSERRGANDTYDNSHPARFAHVDVAKPMPPPCAQKPHLKAPPSPRRDVQCLARAVAATAGCAACPITSSRTRATARGRR